jgi:hypothetical protein
MAFVPSYQTQDLVNKFLYYFILRLTDLLIIIERFINKGILPIQIWPYTQSRVN